LSKIEDLKKVPLHPIERDLLLYLSKGENKGKWFTLELAASGAKLSLDQVRRAVEWLKSKNLLETREEESIFYGLGPEGKVATVEGLPERKLVRLLERSGGSQSLESLSKTLGQDFAISLGQAKKNGWISVARGEAKLDASRVSQKMNEEMLLEKLDQNEKLGSSEVDPQLRKTLESIMARHKGLVNEIREKRVGIKASQLGLEISKLASQKEIDEITPEVIRTGLWRNQPIRAIDVTSPAPNFFGGRKHPFRMFIDEVKEVFVSLGFEEIAGPVVQSALWNFDALYIPQQHSTREMQDTFYLSDLKADLSAYGNEIMLVKAAHETGGETGSLGWRYKWSEEEAKRVVLRTHTTSVTIRYLSENKPTEARVFAVGRVFRNEKPNYKNNPEFHQVEGVTVGPGLNLRNLISIISKFYSKLGFEKVKFWPTYFPYTEPSLQTMAYYGKKERWIELGGMGVFRPEVTIPLGVKNPVLAWGLGLDRLVMMRYDLSDIRDLFGPNLGWLRNARVI
jgi:phenylalanyl-tRNA synthetase alpha chain